MDPMKLDSSDWSSGSGCARVWGGVEYNGLTDIILKFALSCGYNNSMGEPWGSYRSYQSTVLTATRAGHSLSLI